MAFSIVKKLLAMKVERNLNHLCKPYNFKDPITKLLDPKFSKKKDSEVKHNIL